EQQSLGLERQHEGDLDEPTLSVGQIDDAPRRELEQAELLQQSRRAIDDLGMIGGIAPDAPVEPVPRLESEADILGDSEMRKERADLKGAGEAETDTALRRHVGDIETAEPDRAGRWRQ